MRSRDNKSGESFGPAGRWIPSLLCRSNGLGGSPYTSQRFTQLHTLQPHLTHTLRTAVTLVQTPSGLFFLRVHHISGRDAVMKFTRLLCSPSGEARAVVLRVHSRWCQRRPEHPHLPDGARREGGRADGHEDVVMLAFGYAGKPDPREAWIGFSRLCTTCTCASTGCRCIRPR